MKDFLKKNWYFLLMGTLGAINTLLQFIIGAHGSGIVWLIFTAAMFIILFRNYRSWLKK